MKRGYAPAAVIVGLLVFGSPTINPDAMEMVDVGRCLLGFNDGDVACETLDLWAYPPLFSILSGLFSIVWGSWAAAAMMGPLGAGLLVVPMGLMAQRLAGKHGFTFAVVLLVFVPVLRFYGTTADPRLACIAMVAWAWWLLWMGDSSRRRDLVLVGVLVGLSVLTRPEGIVHAVLVLGVAVLLKRGRALWALLGAGALILPYLALLSTRLGGWVASPRAWELRGVGLLEVLPVRWLIQLWGVGATRPPFRDWLEQSTSSGGVEAGTVVSSLLSVIRILATSIPLELHCLAIAGLGVVWAQRSCRKTIAMLGLLCVPAVVVSFSPMGLDLGMPLKNLLAVVVVETVLAAAFLGWLCLLIGPRLDRWLGRATSREKSRGRRELSVCTGLVLILGLVWLPRGYLENRFWPGMSPETERAAMWLAQHSAPSDRVGSSFGSGPVARRAGRMRVTIPSPWEFQSWSDEEIRPQWVVVTALDGLWPLKSRDLHEAVTLEPKAFFSTDHGWAMVLAVR